MTDAERATLKDALERAERLCHEIRFCSNADELWRMVGMRPEVQQTHDAVEKALELTDAAGGGG